MGNTQIDRKFPFAVALLFPDGREMSKRYGLLIFDVLFELPRSKCVTHVARSRHVREDRLPGKHRTFIRGRSRGFLAAISFPKLP